MRVDLTGLPLGPITWQLLDFGGLLTPPLGGPVQRINRAGSRWAMTFTTPMMDMEREGRRWAALLTRAKREGAIVPIPQDAPPVADGIVRVATPSGRLVPVTTYPEAVVRQGHWASIVHDGRRYLDQVATECVAHGGTGTIELQNLLRVPLAAGDTVELCNPKIEGWITSDITWQQDLAHMTSFSFTVSEAE